MDKIFNGEKPALRVSQDEQVHRQTIYQKEKIEPGQKAVDILEVAIDTVLKTMGVNIENEKTIEEDMQNLGIIMTEHSDERAPQLNGFFFFETNGFRDILENPNISPYAWVGAARVDSEGRVYCDIEWFKANRLTEVGGAKLIHG